MKTHLVLCAVALSTALAGAHPAASMPKVNIVPSNPTIMDSLQVGITGGGATTCSSFGGYDCQIDHDTLLVVVTVDYCPSGNGFDLAWTYHRTCNFGLLTVGTYVIEVREDRDARDSQKSSTQDFTIHVSDATPARIATWGRLRAIYR